MFIFHTTPHTSSPGLWTMVAVPPCQTGLVLPWWWPKSSLKSCKWNQCRKINFHSTIRVVGYSWHEGGTYSRAYKKSAGATEGRTHSHAAKIWSSFSSWGFGAVLRHKCYHDGSRKIVMISLQNGKSFPHILIEVPRHTTPSCVFSSVICQLLTQLEHFWVFLGQGICLFQ